MILSDETDIYSTVTVGLVLDISLQHIKEGRLIDCVKEILSRQFAKHLHQVGRLHIVTDEADEVPLKLSEGIARMSNFEVPINIDAPFLFYQTALMVNETGADRLKVIYLTDRYQSLKHHRISQTIKQSNRNGCDIEYLLVNLLGKREKEFAQFALLDHVSVYASLEIEELEEVIDHFLVGEFDGREEAGVGEEGEAIGGESLCQVEGGYSGSVSRPVREGDEAGGGDSLCGEEQSVPDYAD